MRKVETTMLINAPPEKVMDAFVNPASLKIWREVERTLIDLRKGGVYVLAWNISPTGFGFIENGTIKTYVSGKRLYISNLLYFNPERMVFGPMTLKIKTNLFRGKTKLILTQEGLLDGPDWDWYYEAIRFAWPATLSQLKMLIEGNNFKIEL